MAEQDEERETLKNTSVLRCATKVEKVKLYATFIPHTPDVPKFPNQHQHIVGLR